MANLIENDKILLGGVVSGGANNGKDAIKTSNALHNSILDSISTGIVSEYTLGINTSTTIDIGAFKAVFSPNNYSDGIATLPIEVDYAGVTGLIISDVATNIFTYVGIISNGSLTQQNTEFTATQKKTIAPVCVVFHPASAILNISGLSINPTNTQSQLDDSQQTVNLSGNTYRKGTGNFNITKDSGESFRMGTNSSSLSNSNRITSSLLTDTGIFYSYKKATEADGYKIEDSVADVDLTKYDDGSGTLASLTGSQVSIQRGYFVPYLGVTIIEYGQTVYTDLKDALDNINESHVPNPLLDQSELRFYLFEQANASNLTNAIFYNVGELTLARESQNRLDRSQSIKASVTNSFDPNIAKFLVVDMDANMTNLTISKDPTEDGTEIVIQIEWDGTAGRTFSLDTGKFIGGLDVGQPDSTGVINNTNYVNCYWSVKSGKYNIVGNTRRYP